MYYCKPITAVLDFCKYLMVLFGKPASKLLQQSTFEMTRASCRSCTAQPDTVGKV